MSKAHYFYFPQTVKELDRMVKVHQSDFEHLLGDTFSEEELTIHEPVLDDIGAIFVQPIFSEMTFEDFYPNEKEGPRQKFFFEACQSSICLENIPEFSLNPFQVTYLIELLRNFDEVLIDTGGTNELMFKGEYLTNLKRYKNIFSLLKEEEPKPKEAKTTRPVDPIDFLISDVYKEMDRLDELKISESMTGMSEKLIKTYASLKEEKLDASSLLRKSGLNAKDFDDNLERLKFHLRKL